MHLLTADAVKCLVVRTLIISDALESFNFAVHFVRQLSTELSAYLNMPAATGTKRVKVRISSHLYISAQSDMSIGRFRL